MIAMYHVIVIDGQLRSLQIGLETSRIGKRPLSMLRFIDEMWWMARPYRLMGVGHLFDSPQAHGRSDDDVSLLCTCHPLFIFHYISSPFFSIAGQ